MRISDWSSDVCSSDLTHPYGERTALTSGRNKMVRKLDETERGALLARFPQWTHEPSRDAITRQFKLDDFPQAFGFMASVAILDEKLDHPPERSEAGREGKEGVGKCRTRGTHRH